jgi:hypothetical protein
MKLNRLLPSLLTLLVCSSYSYADQSQLNPGDLVFLAANSDAPDTFDFTPLVNIAAGTVIHFTDNSRSGTGTGFADWRKNSPVGSFSESPYFTWVAPSATAAGTKISIPDTVHGTMGLATAGDSLFAFQGDIYNPKFIAAVGWTSTVPFITTGTASSNNSYLPSSLTLGISAVGIAVNTDNAAYNGITSGTAEALRSAANTATNWITSETVVQAGPASLTVTDAVNAPLATKQVAGYGFGPNTANYTENPTVIAANTTLSTFGFTGAGSKDVNGDSALTGQSFLVAGGWNTATLAVASQYFGFTLTVEPGYTLDLADIGFAYQSSENISVAAFYSNDGFATSTPLGAGIDVTNTNVGVASYADLGVVGLSGPIEFRFYGYNAATGTGSLEIDEVWLQGSTIPVPEPASALVGSLGLLLLLRRRR